MCPPPAEPIRPVGPVAGGTYVDHAQIAERLHGRRPRHEDEPDEGEQRRREQRRRRQEEGAPVPAAVVRDPRSYDDHGRRPDDVDEPDLPHVDATA